MSDYIPTTGEMREWYVRRDRTGRSSRKEYELEFDAWLAQERAKAQAEALRDAANALKTLRKYGFSGYGYEKWLHVRANEIEGMES